MTPKAKRPRCSICRHPQLPEIQKCVIEKIPLDEIVFRFEGIKRSALHRHLSNHMRGTPTGKGASRDSGSGLRKRQATKSRSMPDDEPLDAKGIIREAERILRRSEEIVTRAEDNDDFRLALAAIDRCQKAVDSLAKIAGLVGPDIVIDQRQQVNIYAAWSTSALEALQTFHAALESGASVADACRAVQGQDSTKPRALNPGRSEEAA